MSVSSMPTRKVTVIAQDPHVTSDGKILRAQVEVPSESLGPGPQGFRVHVIDYDASTDVLLKAAVLDPASDPFTALSDEELLASPAFHAQNVYAIVMRTLGRFEYALGRRVEWSFGGHQLKVAPHAFIDANAFYSKQDQGLFFGYFHSSLDSGHVFTCLSHDIVAHETAHAVLDGLHERYTDPSSDDQAAFHEGFGDVVALLSVFSQPEVIRAQMARFGVSSRTTARRTSKPVRSIRKSLLTAKALRDGPIAKLGEQMGSELAKARGNALRHSTKLPRSAAWKDDPEYKEPHRRGEILVAAVLDVLCRVWSARVVSLGSIEKGMVDLERVVEDGARVADHLLTIAIRALDYAPPVDLRFGDFLSAMLTADRELFADDSAYRFREAVRESFQQFGIEPASDHQGEGTWTPIPADRSGLRYEMNRFEPLQRDENEVFRFIWENRRKLGVHPDAYCRVLSVRPCVRQGADGCVLRETVARYHELLTLKASELGMVTLVSRGASGGARGRGRRLQVPEGLDPEQEVRLYGGGTLVFDDFGRLKFHIKNHVDSPRQEGRLKDLVDNGYFAPERGATTFAAMHLARALPSLSTRASREDQ